MGGLTESPLKGKGHLTVGYGDSGSVPHTFFLREGQNVDVGILKLFLSKEQVNLSHVAQSSPFVPLEGRLTNSSLPFDSSCGMVQAAVREGSDPSLPWDTIEIPEVQRLAN